MNALTFLDTPIGTLRIEAGEDGIHAVRRMFTPPTEAPRPNDATRRAAAQLREYFAGTRRAFNLPLAPEGTDFQRAVWAALTEVPWGETTSYAALARAVGRPGAARAVGGAVGANPLLILIPCHRVLRIDGALGGFSAGLDAKRILLAREGIAVPEP